ncbi:hypothetical protein L6R49_27850 [Myxococcota bacterium]|nr:hypothetical protein [Myxococcota bacterium]
MQARDLFIAAFLLSQLLLPLRWYALRDPADPYDERFAWRMFSPERMVRCTANVRIDGAPVELGREVHSAWITLVERGRMDVVGAVTERLCLTHPGGDLRLSLTCREIDGAVTTLVEPTTNLCGAPP